MSATTFPPAPRRQKSNLARRLQPKFGSDGLIPCITQDVNTGQVLMFAFYECGRSLAEDPEHEEGDLLEPLAQQALGERRGIRGTCRS